MDLKNAYKDLRYSIRDITINKQYRRRLKNVDFSLITSDCIGGVISKDLRVRMDSPTRNFYFDAADYINFCQHLDKYLSMSLTPFSDPESPYLTAKLGEIKLYLVHYSSFEQAQEKWEIRKARVHKDNMFFIMTDRNHCDEADIKAFDALPYANKVCFTHIPYPQYESTYYLHGSEEDEYVKDVSGYIHQWWIKRYYDHFDFVTWLNEGGHNWPK